MNYKTELPLVILAGGLGSRLKNVYGSFPKILKPLGNKIFLDYFLDNVFNLGFKNLIFILQNEKELIHNNILDRNNDRFFIKVLTDGENRLGTGGSIIKNLSVLPDRFWVTYGDTLLNLEIEKMEKKFIDSKKDLFISVIEKEKVKHLPNLLINNQVEEYSKTKNIDFNFVDYGLFICNRKLFFPYEKQKKYIDLSKVLQDSIGINNIDYYPVNKRFFEIGNNESYSELDLKLKKVTLKELWNE